MGESPGRRQLKLIMIALYEIAIISFQSVERSVLQTVLLHHHARCNSDSPLIQVLAK